VQAAGLVVDGGGEARGPRSPRPLQAKLGSTERVGIGAHPGAQIDQRPAGLAQGEDRRRLAAATPAPAGPETAWVRDRCVARFGRRSRRAGHAPVVAAAVSAARWISVIGATVAFDRMRNVAGGTSKTAVGRPA